MSVAMAGNDRPDSENLARFRDDGVVRLCDVVAGNDITKLRSDFWHEVDQKFSIREDDPDTWFSNPHNPAGNGSRRLSGMNPVMADLRENNKLLAAEAAIQVEVDRLFGAGRWKPLHKWYSLLTFPGEQTRWSLPHTSWHNDEPIVVGDNEPWSIFVFVFLDRVERSTGPTVAITGSHRRGEAIASEKGVRSEREVRAFDHVNSGLFADPGNLRLLPVGQLLPELTSTNEWFRDLVADTADVRRVERYMGEGTAHGGIDSRVVDLTAEAGDVIIFDPRCLHTYSANVSDRPRQILRIDFRRTT